MPLTLTFNYFKEKKPEHYEEVIQLINTSSFYTEGFAPRQTTVEYCWEEVDEEGCATGTYCNYNEGDEPEENSRLIVIGCDGMVFEDDSLWISVDDYWKALDEARVKF